MNGKTILRSDSDPLDPLIRVHPRPILVHLASAGCVGGRRQRLSEAIDFGFVRRSVTAISRQSLSSGYQRPSGKPAR